MQKVYCLVVMALLMVSCHDSLDDRAEKEARNYTERYCPTPVQQNQRTDSLTFDRHTHTYNYYYTLTGPADNADVISDNRQKLKDVLVADTIGRPMHALSSAIYKICVVKSGNEWKVRMAGLPQNEMQNRD